MIKKMISRDTGNSIEIASVDSGLFITVRDEHRDLSIGFNPDAGVLLELAQHIIEAVRDQNAKHR